MIYERLTAVSLFFVFGIVGCGGYHRPVEIIAHRGSSYLAPENTKVAISLAWKQDADAAECDVHLTKDKKIMLMHDDSAKRTTGLDYLVAETDSKKLAALDVGSWKNPVFRDQKTPFLADIIGTVRPGKKLYIEVKCGSEILPYLKSVIESSGKKSQLAILSFNYDVVTNSKKLMPSVRAYWLVDCKRDKLTRQPTDYSFEIIEKAKAAGLDGLSVNYRGVSKKFVRLVRANRLELKVWTVD
jgi:glycerophosphoryl diester phosphodiesterase